MAIKSIEGQPGEGMSMDTITEKIMDEIKTEKVSHAKLKAAKKGKAAPAANKEQGALTLAPTPTPSELVMMPLALIVTHKQVRTDFNDESILELATDIAARGVLQPILLRPNPGMVNFLVIAGEQRFRAAKLAGLENIPAIVGDVDDQVVENMQLAENIQREDLSLKDTAAAIRKIYERCESVTETAAKVRKSKAWVSKHLAASCPSLRSMARDLLEGGFSEDLEIILTVDKLQELDWYACMELCAKIKKGEAGRQTARDEYEAAKLKAEERDREYEECNTPEKKAEREKRQKEQNEACALQRAKAEEERKLTPAYLCQEVSENATTVEEDRTVFSDEQNEILGEHLKKIYLSSVDADHMKTLCEIIRMTATGDNSEIEVAAYVLGMQGLPFDMNYLVQQVTITLEGEG